jgi:hypothetical protein
MRHIGSVSARLIHDWSMRRASFAGHAAGRILRAWTSLRQNGAHLGATAHRASVGGAARRHAGGVRGPRSAVRGPAVAVAGEVGVGVEVAVAVAVGVEDGVEVAVGVRGRVNVETGVWVGAAHGRLTAALGLLAAPPARLVPAAEAAGVLLKRPV